jgi:PAS domain S-box-containing protein
MDRALSIFVPANQTKVVIAAALMIVAIALIDWRLPSYVSLGFLYLFPIMLVSGYLPKSQIAAITLLCTALQEVFSDLPVGEVVPRLVMTSIGFMGTGFFISELARNRRIVLSHFTELRQQAKLREDAEEQLRVLVESSPAAIITVDSAGTVLLANQAAEHLLMPNHGKLEGKSVGEYVPSLQRAVQAQVASPFRTTLQCKGQRGNGEVFLAGVWFSTYKTSSGARLAAIIVDLSEDLRNREDLSLNHLLRNARILMSAVSHEARNLCGAALAVHRNLSKVKALDGNKDFEALGSLIQGLEKLSAMELGPRSDERTCAVDLIPVLDELRVLLESAYEGSQIEMRWRVEDQLPLVRVDRYGVLQAFLNLANNSQRAMRSMSDRVLTISSSIENHSVVVRFEDTGPGIADEQVLFRPFQQNAEVTGLGLYVSRSILRSFGGEISYEKRSRGCCFSVRLPTVRPPRELEHA